jgi:hypothetical protein
MSNIRIRFAIFSICQLLEIEEKNPNTESRKQLNLHLKYKIP